TITNNGGKNYYTFTENGEFTFEFVDAKGRKNSKTAKVDWIYDYEFFFDGKTPNTIVLSNKFYCDGFLWEYSIDGGLTYKKHNTLSSTLTEAEINAMTAQNDLKIRFIKAKNAPAEITIDILPAPAMPNNLYGNDLENKVIGYTDAMEWRIVGTDKWTSYSVEQPKLLGDYSIEVRIAAKGTTLHSAAQTFTFTKDTQDLHNKYVSVDHLKVIDYSSQNVRSGRGEFEYAANAIDGNKNTMWHTDRVAITDDRFIVLELDSPRFLTQVDVIGKENYEWGTIKQGVVYVSVDGVNWTEAATVSDPKLETKDEVKQHNEKTFKFKEPIYAKYIKVQSKESHDYINGDLNGVPRDHFINVTMINVYEDATLKEEETLVYVEYSVKDITNQNVVAHVYSPNSVLTILNNNGSDKYTFTKNGEFTFEYVDAAGKKGSIKAVVDKIDKEAPKAELVFSESTLTKENVTVSIKFNEEVVIENT
ncbi:MAG: discoidin domain-containing protein, partial [Clostridia bacterium]|nr:discoidin domain-containing protein [Clostridia bacterium]